GEIERQRRPERGVVRARPRGARTYRFGRRVKRDVVHDRVLSSLPVRAGKAGHRSSPLARGTSGDTLVSPVMCAWIKLTTHHWLCVPLITSPSSFVNGTNGTTRPL